MLIEITDTNKRNRTMRLQVWEHDEVSLCEPRADTSATRLTSDDLALTRASPKKIIPNQDEGFA